MLTSRPQNHLTDVQDLRSRLKDFAIKLLFCTTHEAEQLIGAFLDGYGALDYTVEAEVELDGSTMIKIAVQLKEGGMFFFVPMYIKAVSQEGEQLSLFEEQPWN